MLEPRIGFSLATQGFVEGTKTAPAALTEDPAASSTQKMMRLFDKDQEVGVTPQGRCVKMPGESPIRPCRFSLSA
jgi:hypothetical protein